MNNGTDVMHVSGGDVTCTPIGTLKGDEAHLLPPCRICGEKASGFHYGANTCEACKVRMRFVRR